MNTNLTERILQVIDYSGDLVKDGTEFIKEQSPLVVQEFLKWNFMEGLITAILTGSIILSVIMFCVVSRKKFDGWIKATDGFVIVPIIPGFFIVCVLIGAGFIPNVKKCLKIKYAPRVYLIEWAANQVKK